MSKRLLAIAAAGAVAMLTLSSCGGSDSGGGTPNAAPTDKVLHLSFLQDPGQPPDPDVYYAGQGLLLTTNLKSPNSEFLDYLGSAYSPRMLSPTGLQKNGGSDFAQNYLTSHDLGTGPYTLTDAQVGSHYGMAAFPDYWGPKPYFEKVELPVITDTSAQQLQFNNGQLAAILHDLPSSAVEQYLNNSKYSHYSLPTMMANFIYINPNKGIMKDQATRTAMMNAIDVDSRGQQTSLDRGKIGD